MARPTGRPIREELLEAACALVQEVGVNAFSYGHLAKQLGISAPSIHHHFPTKDDLVGEITARYRQDFAVQRDLIDEPTAAGCLDAYAELFSATSARELMCICGSIAGDWSTVGETARTEAKLFFDEQVVWLTDQLEAGIAGKEFTFDVETHDAAIAVLAALEGSLLMARASGEPLLPRSVSASLVGLLR